MQTYIIKELQNKQSDCKGIQICAKTLRAAKIAATKAQMFKGTVMSVESDLGNVLAYREGGKWVDVV